MPKLKDTPSLKLLVDFGVWFPRWIFWWIFGAISLGKTSRKKIHRKINKKSTIFKGTFWPKSIQGKFWFDQKCLFWRLQARHVCNNFARFSRQFLAEKHRNTWWMHPADPLCRADEVQQGLLKGKDPAILKPLRVENHYGDSNLPVLPLLGCLDFLGKC